MVRRFANSRKTFGFETNLFFRITASRDDMYLFDPSFLSKLLSREDPNEMKYWAKQNNVAALSKKLLLFPFYANDHWSLFVVAHPGYIATNTSRRSKSCHPYLLYFDPLGSNSSHNQNQVATSIRYWLNRVWQLESSDDFEQRLPFSRHSLPLHRVEGEYFWSQLKSHD